MSDVRDPCFSCPHSVHGRSAARTNHPFIGPLPGSDSPLDALRRLVPGLMRVLQPGQSLATEGDAPGEILGVLSGLIRCYRLTADGRRHIGRFGGPGTIVGLGLLGVQRHSADAITPTRIVSFRAPVVEAAADSDPAVRAAVMKAMAEELNDRERLQLRLGRLAAEQRIADFLLELARRTPDGSPCEIPMCRADIADHLGVTIETVSRAVHRFERRGLIRLDDPRRFRILSSAAMRAFVLGGEQPAAGTPCTRLPAAQAMTLPAPQSPAAS